MSLDVQSVKWVVMLLLIVEDVQLDAAQVA